MMKKQFTVLALLVSAFSALAQADDSAIQQTLKKVGLQQAEIQPSPLPGMKTVLTESGVIYITEDGKHMIQGPLYDVSGAQPVNVTNQLLDKKVSCMSRWRTTTRWVSRCAISPSRAKG